mgnify:CR=1 FL=1
MQVVAWGTFDVGKPRVRIALRGLRENGVSVYECHADVWAGVEDKSQLFGFLPKIRKLGQWLLSYPKLIWCYLKAPRHDVVLVPYMGHLDVLVLWPFAKLRGANVVWDAFLSLYNTIVEDRRIIASKNPLAWLIYAFEWLATRAADCVVLDTAAHADYFARRYSLSEDKLAYVHVGVESERCPLLRSLEPKVPNKPLTVLFYGQFIPLHGIPTIIEAARQLDDGSVHWVLIGQGQEEASIRASLELDPIKNIEWRSWVPYEELIGLIGLSDICLGVFGESEKAGRVIPNKVFQVIAAGRPLVTRDGPGIRELLADTEPGLKLVPPADSSALVAALSQMISARDSFVGVDLFEEAREKISCSSIGMQWVGCISVAAKGSLKRRRWH